MKKTIAFVLALAFVFSVFSGFSFARLVDNGENDIYYDGGHASADLECLPDKDVLYSANGVDLYITNNPGELPKYATIAGNHIYMNEFIGIMAEFIINEEKGNTTYVFRNSISEKSIEYEKMMSGTLTKQEYLALAYDTVDYINKKGEAPGYIQTPLGAMSFSSIIGAFARVGSLYRQTSILPESVEVTSWESPMPAPPQVGTVEFKTSSVFAACQSVNTYIAENKACPPYVTIENEQVFMPEFLVLVSKIIVDASNGYVDDIIERSEAAYIEKSYENITGVIFESWDYVETAQSVLNYVDNSPECAVKGFINTQTVGALSAETLIRTFVKICIRYASSGILIDSIIVEPWHESLPTPPEDSVAPDYTYLNFVDILKGARRLVVAIESTDEMPKYVTLAENTRVYIGTMLRLFAATVSNINRGKANNMPLKEIATPKSAVSETITEVTFTKTSYIKLAQRIATAVYTNNAVPAYVTTEFGTMNHYNMIYLFARALDYYFANGFLPDEISVTAW
ncbi:MAG: hypothetical protein IJF80_06685 [Clostridia bacterium]|nr:hypothetical protein [Clostridia bacterium]